MPVRLSERNPSVPKDRLLAQLAHPPNVPGGVYLDGGYGVGKTLLLVALAREAALSQAGEPAGVSHREWGRLPLWQSRRSNRRRHERRR